VAKSKRGRQKSKRKAPVAVIALGGNALAPHERSNIHDQFGHTRASLGPIVELAMDGWNVCIVHGNGPQVGDELVRNELARYNAPPLPLGVLVAATAGWIGYMVQQSLENALRRLGSRRAVATVVTQVHVDPNDPRLKNPTKFIGREVSEKRATELRREGHIIKKDGRGRWRRVVGSPYPLAIHELPIIKTLVESGVLVIAAGGGGAPIYDDREFGWEGVDAVVDKALRQISVADAERLDRAGQFGEGSMAPKIRAAVDFVRRTGGKAVITELQHGQAAVRGNAGTTITK
jgi:carbamate kinase